MGPKMFIFKLFIHIKIFSITIVIILVLLRAVVIYQRHRLFLGGESMESRQIGSVAVFICSWHPLAFGAIKELLISAMYEVRKFEQIPSNPLEGPNRILILDTCSVKNWTKIAIEWNRMGGRSIVLIQKRLESPEEESRFIYLGIHAIILVPNIDTELPSAIQAVA